MILKVTPIGKKRKFSNSAETDEKHFFIALIC